MRAVFNTMVKFLSTSIIALAVILLFLAAYTGLQSLKMQIPVGKAESATLSTATTYTIATATTQATPTAEPTATNTPTPQVIILEPTLGVNTRVLKNGLKQVPPPAGDLPYLQWNTIKVVRAVDTQETGEVSVYNATEEDCKTSLLENAKKVYQASKRAGSSWRVTAAKVQTESAFIQFKTGAGGQCSLLQNYAGEPAWCMMQIYLPAHPEVNVEALGNIDYCIEVGMADYMGKLRAYGGDELQAVACYKGFCQQGYLGKNDPGFIKNFMGVYNDAGIGLAGEFIPYDETELLAKFPDWRVE